MKVTRDNVSKTEVKLTIEVTAEEMQPFLITAANHIGEHVETPGFRKGKATYEAIVNNVGEMRVLEEAIEPAVRLHLAQALMDEDLDTVGQPKVDIEKMAPGNALVFTAVATLMPKVKKMGNIDKLKVEKKSTEVDAKEIERSMNDLARMQTKEVRAEGGAVVGEKDMAVVDLDMKKGGVPVEGGAAKGFKIYMTEETYIPGMKEEVKGMKEGEDKEFAIDFPEEHHIKHLAGQKIECSLKVNEIHHLEVPKIDDEFAKTVGLKDLADMKAKIEENLKAENEDNEKRRQEREALEMLADKSSFEDIPDFLIDDEIEKMVHELEHSVESQGGKFEDYLKSIKKTPEEMRAEFREQAEVRVKVALVLREVAKAEKIEATDEDVQAEIDKQAKMYEGHEEALAKVNSPEYREYIQYRMRNEKVIAHLLDKMVK